MSFDALALSAVRDELEHLLQHGRLQRLAFVDELSLAAEFFSPGAGRGCVLFSAHPELGRVQRLEHLPIRGLERDTPFALVVRKHLRGARLRVLRQPRLERVLELDFDQRDATGEHYRVLLIVEAMGRRSNLVLVDQDGAIVDAARRAPPSRNPRRPVLPHLPYVPPPPQERQLPEHLTADDLARGVAGRADTLAAYLVQRVAGLSPQATRELVFRATGAADTPAANADWSGVLGAIRDFMAPLETHQWTPSVAFHDGQPRAYAPYLLTHLPGARPMATISAAMAAYYAGTPTPARGDALAGERAALLAALDTRMRTSQRRIAALELQLNSSREQQEPLRRAGELILTHQYDIDVGATELAVDGERIALDPSLGPVENAQVYFARYRKAREATERVPGLLEEARTQAAH
ncbi:MAG: NFACT family protein, partial [Chloroflexota bacterium]|nr:NFACT family protein [Chloroflexota bacterium]